MTEEARYCLSEAARCYRLARGRPRRDKNSRASNDVCEHDAYEVARTTKPTTPRPAARKSPPRRVFARHGALLSVDPSGPSALSVPSGFASSGVQASALGGAVKMFSANSPNWLNSVNNNIGTNGILPNTAQFAGVSNPLGLSNNNAFGRIWPANSPFGLDGPGSSSILDPTGLPLKGPPNPKIGGVYVGNLTNRNVVTTPSQPQVIPGGLNTGAVGTALLGPYRTAAARRCSQLSLPTARSCRSTL
jgi:hypothetical protein